MSNNRKISTITRRSLIKAASGALLAPSPAFAERPKRNVLFIIVDDLNDFPAPFRGYEGISTPHFDALAKAGAIFYSAMAHVPECLPSRASFLSGVAAWKSGIYDNGSNYKKGRYPANHLYLPGWFRKNGGKAKYSGKFHHGFGAQNPDGDFDLYFVPPNYKQSVFDLGVHRSRLANYRNKDDQFDFGPGAEGGEFDTQITDWTIDRMESGFLSKEDHHFLGCGLRRPHLPFVVPDEYFTLYPEDPAPPPGYWPSATNYKENAPDRADLPLPAKKLGSRGTGRMLDITNEHNAMLRAYLASVSFADAQIGRMLDAYLSLELYKTTYLVVLSDNGFFLGEKKLYQKFALWERALRVPLIICGPGIEPQVQYKPVSLLDIYPTVCGLAGLPVPNWCDGRDISSWLLQNTEIPDAGAVSVLRKGSEFYWRARDGVASLTSYGNQTFEAYNHDRNSDRFDPHEFYNIAAVLENTEKQKLLNLAPPWWADPV